MNKKDPPTVFVVDPPWYFKGRVFKTGNSADHYPCIKTPDICEMVAEATLEFDRCVLFLWRLASMQQDALDVVRESGFELKSELDWQKTTVKGKQHFGQGYYVRADHEICLLATRGTHCEPVVRNERQSFQAPVREHSRKPDEFYQKIERMYPDSLRIEMFARQVRPGWVQFGNELGKFL